MSQPNEPMDGDRDENALNQADSSISDEERDYQYQDQEPDPDSGDREIESVNSGRRRGQLVPLTLLGGLVAVALYIMASGDDSSGEETSIPEDERPTISSSARVPSLPSPPPLPAEPEPEPEPAPQNDEVIRTDQLAPAPPRTRPGVADQEDVVTPEERRRRGSMLAFGDSSSNTGGSAGSVSPTAVSQGQSGQGQGLGMGGQDESPLASLTTAERLSGQRAQIIANRHMTITQGTAIPCALETAIDSTLPGFVRCRVTQDIYGTSGKVPLIDRGSTFVGQYQSGLALGDARLFVLWNRIETPKGIVINVDSPGTDQLGRAGHSGHVDTRFWDRIGAAMVFSLFEDVGDYMVAEATNGSSQNTINLGNSADTASSASEMLLEQYMDIPPRLTKNQGGRIHVFVARDLDFSGVYELANR